MEGTQEVSEADVGGIAAGLIAAAVHCSDSRGGSCSETHKKGTDAVESGTGRYTAERLS